jgi:hypothetical protein
MRSTWKALTATTLLTCIATGTAWAGTCARPASPALIGLWESPKTSRGGIGQTLEFRQDGTFVQATVVLLNSRYEVSGDHVTLTPTSPDQGGPLELKLRVEGDRLIETLSADVSFEKRRVGKPEAGAPPIVGIWRYGQNQIVTAYENYTRDGRMLFRISLRSFTGCYRLQGDRLTLSNPCGKEVTMPFHQSSGELVVESPGSEPFTYDLAPEGPWYDREHPPGAHRCR